MRFFLATPPPDGTRSMRPCLLVFCDSAECAWARELGADTLSAARWRAQRRSISVHFTEAPLLDGQRWRAVRDARREVISLVDFRSLREVEKWGA